MHMTCNWNCSEAQRVKAGRRLSSSFFALATIAPRVPVSRGNSRHLPSFFPRIAAQFRAFCPRMTRVSRAFRKFFGAFCPSFPSDLNPFSSPGGHRNSFPKLLRTQGTLKPREPYSISGSINSGLPRRATRTCWRHGHSPVKKSPPVHVPEIDQREREEKKNAPKFNVGVQSSLLASLLQPIHTI